MTGRALRWALRSYLRAVGRYNDRRTCTWPNQTHTPLNEDDQ